MGAARDVALNSLPFRGISINAESASNVVAITVIPSDSGILFINKEESGTVTYTLPAVADGKGKIFWFYEGYNVAIKVKILTANIVGDATNKVASGDGTLGTCCFVVGDGSYYYLFAIMGTWTVAST